LRNSNFRVAWCEPGLCCVAWNRWRLGVQTCTSDRWLSPARGNKKEPGRFGPLSARCGAWPLKKLRSEYEVGVSPQTGETSTSSCSSRARMSRTIERFFCAKGAAIRRFRRSKTQTPRGKRGIGTEESQNPHPETRRAVTPRSFHRVKGVLPARTSHVRFPRRSQWVDATLGRSPPSRAQIAGSRSRAFIQTEHHPGQGLIEYSRTKRFSMGKCCRIN
jgi:hypothetical protein